MATRFRLIRSHTLRVLQSVLAIALLLPLAACKKATETAIERAIGNKIDMDNDRGSMTIKSEEGQIKVATSQDGQGVPLPEDFPADVFLPGHSTINSAMDMADMKMVNMTTDASSGEVSAMIQKAMQAKGWKREMAMQAAEGSATLVYSKDKRQAIYQMMTGDKGGTQLAVRTGGEG